MYIYTFVHTCNGTQMVQTSGSWGSGKKTDLEHFMSSFNFFFCGKLELYSIIIASQPKKKWGYV